MNTDKLLEKKIKNLISGNGERIAEYNPGDLFATGRTGQ